MAEMKRLVFGEGLMSPSLDGSKRFTIRKYREVSHNLSKGEIILGEFKDGLNVLLQITDDTIKDTFKRLKKLEESVDKNGYWFDEKYFEELKSYYPDLTWDDMGAVIFFEVLKINGVPVVSINEYAQ